MASPLAALSIAIGALAVLGSMGFVSASPSATTEGPTTAPVGPPALVTDAVAVPAGVAATPIPSAAPILLTLTLASADPAGLANFLENVESPFSPDYRQFLTVPQYETAYAPAPSTVSGVVAALASAGGRNVTVAPGRLAVTAVVPASAIPSLVGVRLEGIGRSGEIPIYTAVGTPRLAPTLVGKVVGVGGLSDAGNSALSYELGRERTVEARVAAPGAPRNEFVLGVPPSDQWFLGSDFSQAYGAYQLFPGNSTNPNATYPTHVAIATLLAGGYNATSAVNLPPWNPAVVGWYLNQTLAPWWPDPTIVGEPVTAAGVTPPVPGSNGVLNDSSLDQVENSLDLEMAASLAPGAPVYNFYFAGSLFSGNPAWSSLADDFAMDLSAALNFSYGSARLGVVSGSFGLPNLNDSLWDSDLEEAAATGVTVVIASGDQGNAPDNLTGRPDGPWPGWPGSAAFNLEGSVAVGGASLSLSGRPAGSISPTGALNLTFDRNVTGIANMSTWWDASRGPGNYEGSEGGITAGFYSEPAWQFFSAAGIAITNATLLEHLTSLGRAEPDVAFVANSTIVMYGVNTTDGVYEGDVVEGTSIAAPVFAGILADMVAVKSADSPSTWHSFGFLDPELYRIGSYFATHTSSANPYLDVTKGTNYFFSAGSGWDPTTGWGGIDVPLFLAADANRSVEAYTYTGPTEGLPSSGSGGGLPWTELYLVIGGGVIVAVILVIATARPRRPTTPSTVPFGATSPGAAGFGPGVQGGIYPGATFLCPYCGAVRPAEPVRCPQCGAY